MLFRSRAVGVIKHAHTEQLQRFRGGYHFVKANNVLCSYRGGQIAVRVHRSAAVKHFCEDLLVCLQITHFLLTPGKQGFWLDAGQHQYVWHSHTLGMAKQFQWVILQFLWPFLFKYILCEIDLHAIHEGLCHLILEILGKINICCFERRKDDFFGLKCWNTFSIQPPSKYYLSRSWL